MTPERIAELAQQAGMLKPCGDHLVCGNCEVYAWGKGFVKFTRFATLIRGEALEEAAKIAEEHVWYSYEDDGPTDVPERLAKIFRLIKNPDEPMPRGEYYDQQE